jgi:hypothetical protein
MGEIAFGIRGRRRSRGRKISVPKRTSCRCQREEVEWWTPSIRQAARTLPISLASANKRRRLR